MIAYKTLETGLQNLIKSLKRKKYRDENKLFLAEGYKICAELLPGNYPLSFIVIPGNPSHESESLALEFAKKNIPVYKTPKKIFNPLCDTETPQDILAIVGFKEHHPDSLKSFIALDAVADPGNTGTIIRTAEWFGFNQIILGKGCADIYNPKTIRATMGSVLRMKIINTNDLKGYITTYFAGHTILGAYLDGSQQIDKFRFPEKFGIIFGNESAGISGDLNAIIDQRIMIPAIGNAESLNVAVAAGIFCYLASVNKR